MLSFDVAGVVRRLLLPVLPGLALLAGSFAAAPAGAVSGCIPTAGAPGDARAVPVRDDRGPALGAREIELTFLGHSSFLIRTPGNATAITDYNGYIRGDHAPDIVTMNRAHSTHYTDDVEPGVIHILRGWDEAGIARHNVLHRDLRVRNVPTNIRGRAGGTDYAGNSIFVFEAVGLCIAHLGHLHHRLAPEQRADIGLVHVLLAPIDDGMTMPQALLAEVVDELRPRYVVPMHYSHRGLVERFAELMVSRGHPVRTHDSPTVRLSEDRLPPRTTLLVLPGGRF